MTTRMTPSEIAARDHRLGDYEDNWRSVEGRYPGFTDYDVQCYLDGIKASERRAIYSDYEYLDPVYLGDYEPEQAYGSAGDYREHQRYGGTRESY